MATNLIGALGAGSGIDIKALAESLVEAERAPKKNQIDQKITKTEARISGYAAMKYALSELKAALEKLNDGSDFSSVKASNNQPTALGVSASKSAQAGALSVTVNAIAKAQRSPSLAFTSPTTFLNKGNSFNLTLTVGEGTSAVVNTIPVKTATPAGMVAAINAQACGVTAQLVNADGGCRVVLTGQTGSANNFTVSVPAASTPPSQLTLVQHTDTVLKFEASGDSTDVSVSYENSAGETVVLPLKRKSSDGYWYPANGAVIPPTATPLTLNETKSSLVAVMPDFSNPTSTVVDPTRQTASDAEIVVNGFTFTRASNSISDAVDGVTLDLYTVTTSPAEVTLGRETGDVRSNIKALADAYNTFSESLKVLGDKGSQVEGFGGVLAGESLLRSVESQVRAFIGKKSDVTGEYIQSARDVGLNFNNQGRLLVDDKVLDAALAQHYDEVVNMFSAGTDGKTMLSETPGGLAGDAVRKIDRMLLYTGAINSQSRSAEAEKSRYQKELLALSERMDKIMNRYLNQFSVMESIVGSSNSTRAGLKSTFEGMSGSSR